MNAADGNFIVESTVGAELAIFSFPRTYGFYAAAQSVSFRNEGYFEVSAMAGTAYAFFGGYDTKGQPVVNTGTVVVTSGYDAFGFWMGQSSTFLNTGTIQVHAAEVAVGVYLVDYLSGHFTNQGVISATNAAGSPFASIGVFASHANDSDVLFTNSGTIVADIAFLSDDHDSPTNNNRDTFVNTGSIFGDMIMGDGSDRIVNEGVMAGYADLGQLDDRFDGFYGIYDGLIDGGTGNDVLVASRGEQILFGNYGRDALYAGDGDDLLIGGRGSDSMNGGAGFDLLYYGDSWSAVTVDFVTGLANDGGGIDRFRNMEGVIGSAYGDTIAGGNAADYLEGAGGNDLISGGGGADTILGDTGDDQLSGGAGADIFMVSIGDGNDVITDFNPQEDRLEIYGFTAALQIEQLGADARVVLSATQSVLLRNVQASSLLPGQQLAFFAQPLLPPPAPTLPEVDTQLVDTDGFRLYAGETLRVVNPAYERDLPNLHVRHAGVNLAESGGRSVYVAGAMVLEVAADEGIATAFFGALEVFVFSTGSVDVRTTGTVMARGMTGASLLNDGDFRVVSSDSAAPVFDNTELQGGFGQQTRLSSAVGALCTSGSTINNGSIEASSTRISIGIISTNNIDSARGFWNTGDILVSGGMASIGVLFAGSGSGRNQDRPSWVNSGDIIVADTNAVADSVGLAIAFQITSSGTYEALGAQFWNSGIIEADYALKWYVGGSPDRGGTYSFYNSGELRGRVDLSAGAETICNRGLITGRIDLREGNDLFDGRGGSQLAGIFGGLGDDILYGGSLADTIDGGGGDDIIAGGGGADLLTGGAGSDIFHFEAGFGADIVADFTAGTTQDTVRVSGYANYLSVQQLGADTLVTFSASDTILLRNVVTASLTAADFLFSAAALAVANILTAPGRPRQIDFTLTPGQPPAFATIPGLTFSGTAGSDDLTGDTGDDLLDGMAGADVMRGGPGNDIYLVDAFGDQVNEAAGEGSDTIYTAVSYQLGAGQSVEVLAAQDNSQTTALSLFGNELANVLFGNNGANFLDGAAGADIMTGFGGDDIYAIDNAGDLVDEAVGGGNDSIFTTFSYVLGLGASVETLAARDNSLTVTMNLFGNELNNVIFGNNGVNFIDGSTGADIMTGFGGDDTYAVDNAGDVVIEDAGRGNDAIFTTFSYVLGLGMSVETLASRDNSLTSAMNLFGNELDNFIFGNNGANFIDGGQGADTMTGFGGDDSYIVDNVNDRVVENPGGGNDAIYTTFSYALAATHSIETLAARDNSLTVALNLTGNELNNTLLGNNGANVLNGGGGADVLVGFGGADTFALTTAAAAGNADYIADFVAGTDKIALDAALFSGIGSPGSFNAAAFVAGSAAADADDRIIYNAANSQLFYDADGNGAGAAVLLATLSGNPTLTASDFQVI